MPGKRAARVGLRLVFGGAGRKLERMSFGEVLSAALTPVALISGVGLLLLSMVNRYSQTTTRVRGLLEKVRAGTEPQARASLAILYRRCALLRNAILVMLASVVCSGCIVFVTVVEGLAGVDAGMLKSILLFASGLSLLVSTLLFGWDMFLSLKALRREIDALPAHRE
jgi:hypothetical protein